MTKKLSLLLCSVILLTLSGCSDETVISSQSSSAHNSSFECVSSETEDSADTSSETSSSNISVSSENTEICLSSIESTYESQESVSSETVQNSSAMSSSEDTESFIPPITYAIEKDTAEISRLIAEYINEYRNNLGVSKAVVLPGLTCYAEYRSRQLVSNFAHDTKEERAAATALKYGQYVDPSLFGMTGEPYYTANCGEAIAKADFAGTVEGIAEKFAKLARNSPDHWSYVGSEQYQYIAVGVTYEEGVWYCCIAVTIKNSDEQ